MLSAYSERSGLDRETALRVAGAFGGGMARHGETCGAVTGALMVIGLRHGKTSPEDDDARELTYAVAQDLIDRFRERNRTLRCRELLGHDMSTPEGLAQIRQQDLVARICPRFVSDALEILDELL